MDYIYLIIIAIITGISIFGACIFLCRYNWFLAVCCSNSLYTYFAFSSHTNTSHLDLEVPKDSLNPDGLIRVKAESPLSLALGTKNDQSTETDQGLTSTVATVSGYPTAI